MTAMPAPAAFAVMPPHATTRARRHVTVWQLLVWAYRDQRAGGTYGTAHLYDDEPHSCSTDGVAAMLRLGEVGCFVDGGEWKGLSDRMHPDARTVGWAISHIAGTHGLEVARLVAQHAAQGEMPERPTTAPAPFPMAADRQRDERWGRSMIHGVRFDYRILVAERVADRTPRMEFRGRGRKVCVGYDVVSAPVEYCPIEWWPSVAMVKHGHAICDAFEMGLDAVGKFLRSAELVGHVLELPQNR